MHAPIKPSFKTLLLLKFGLPESVAVALTMSFAISLSLSLRLFGRRNRTAEPVQGTEARVFRKKGAQKKGQTSLVV